MQSTFGSVSSPDGLAFNSTGDLFVTDHSAGTIDEFTPDGTESTFASGLNGPTALAFNSAGDLFESDFGSGNIYEFTPTGVRSTYASGLQRPNGLAFDSAGNLFVASQAGDTAGSILKIAPGGVKSVFASGLYPIGLAFNSAGTLFEADGFGILEFTPGGVQSKFVDYTALGPSIPPVSSEPVAMAFDGAGNLFVSVWTVNTPVTNDNIDEVTPGGVVSTFVSGLDYPEYLAFQPVPEPSVWSMLGMSGLTLLAFRRKSV